MKFYFSVFLTMFFVLACGSDRGDPVAPGGGSGPGANRANLAVVESNQYEACQVSLDLIVDNYYKATSVVPSANDPDNQVRIMGNHSSYAFVSAIAPDSNGTSDPYSLNLEIKYKDYYSETGKLFIRGALEMYGSVVGNASHLSELHLYGTVEISGDYAYTVEFDGFGVGLDANGQAINLPFAYAKYWVCGPTYTLPNAGTLKVTSGGKTILMWNPHAFDGEYLSDPPPSTCSDSLHYGCPPPGGCN